MGNLKILIVEDDEGSSQLLSYMLNSMAKEIISVTNGFEDVEACKNNTDIDLILMDIQMETLNGYKATEQIRKFNKNVIIIAQTALALPGDREKSILAGCDDYITKPIHKNDLVKLIREYL
jgi:CheY-like chemotaxis protein